MKGISLGIFCFCLVIFFSFLGLKIYRGNRYFKVFIIAWLSSTTLYGILYTLTPPHLYIYSDPYLESLPWVDSLNGLLWLALLSHLFWDGMYMFFLTGFSTGLLARLSEAKEQGLTKKELINFYCTQSENVLVQKRMINLEKGHYIKKSLSGYQLTKKGIGMAHAALFLKKILYLDLGG